mgnify:CR=1 FL=1
MGLVKFSPVHVKSTSDAHKPQRKILIPSSRFPDRKAKAQQGEERIPKYFLTLTDQFHFGWQVLVCKGNESALPLDLCPTTCKFDLGSGDCAPRQEQTTGWSIFAGLAVHPTKTQKEKRTQERIPRQESQPIAWNGPGAMKKAQTN